MDNTHLSASLLKTKGKSNPYSVEIPSVLATKEQHYRDCYVKDYSERLTLPFSSQMKRCSVPFFSFTMMPTAPFSLGVK